MKLVIYGTGSTANIAIDFIGWGRIECFVDTYKAGQYLGDKKIVSLSEYCTSGLIDDSLLIIASENNWQEMEISAQNHGIEKYFVFHESDVIGIRWVLPQTFISRNGIRRSYNEILSYHDFSHFSHVGIYGDNIFLPYLLIELNERIDITDCCVVGNAQSEIIKRLGLRRVSVDEMWDLVDCLVINVRRNEDNIRDLVNDKNHKFTTIDIYDFDGYVPAFQHYELEQFKNIYSGRRCFLIGNGPSLRIEDLNKLHENGEICIGCNKIYQIYDKTNWRADYLCMCDHRAINSCAKDIPNISETVILGDTYQHHKVEFLDNAFYVHLIGELFAPYKPGFSDDIVKGVYMGWNIVYDLMIQIAAYMGFSEMYLLGVDHHFSSNPYNDENHFIKDYFSEEEKRLVDRDPNAFNMEARSLGFQRAEEYSRKNGFRIFNATRGGKLEVFERVDFDSLF